MKKFNNQPPQNNVTLLLSKKLDTKNSTEILNEKLKTSQFKTLKINTESNFKVSIPTKNGNLDNIAKNISLNNHTGIFTDKNNPNYNTFTAFTRGMILNSDGTQKKVIIPGMSGKAQKHTLLAYQGELRAIITHYIKNPQYAVYISDKDYNNQYKAQFVQFLPNGIPLDEKNMVYCPKANLFFQDEKKQELLLAHFYKNFPMAAPNNSLYHWMLFREQFNNIEIIKKSLEIRFPQKLLNKPINIKVEPSDVD